MTNDEDTSVMGSEIHEKTRSDQETGTSDTKQCSPHRRIPKDRQNGEKTEKKKTTHVPSKGKTSISSATRKKKEKKQKKEEKDKKEHRKKKEKDQAKRRGPNARNKKRSVKTTALWGPIGKEANMSGSFPQPTTNLDFAMTMTNVQSGFHAISSLIELYKHKT